MLSETLYHTSQLSAVYPDAAAFKDVACGILISVLSRDDASYLMWFKPEVIQTVNWAGDPNKPVVTGDNMLSIISPRNSFEVWSQSVAGASALWNSEELRSVTRLREEILFFINQKAAELIALNDKLKVAYEELDIFSHTIAHDLKNPLSSVLGYAHLLKMEDNDPDTSHSIDRIIAAGKRMSRMITEILQHSKAGQTELNFCSVNVRPMIEDFIVDLAIAYEPGRVVFTIGELPLIQGDPVMLCQVFENLLGNAVKYSQGADIIRISVTATVQGPEIIFRISDNGQGIDHGQEHKIFDLFQRASNVGTIEGTGVGLAIVRKIMDRHGGKIQVKSTFGIGTTFFLHFKQNIIGQHQAAT
ncbi:ATP-binding protein [Dyadobacter chenhuakuii]|uniref:histidine kinase n=1 Tax=Dyadobacter chenhuakuii TaxID=2909339 RepID=A0A9X1QA24_9BACT|nr:ATP-binding protein [Dyadobacter chenhuakuii]MCF2496707.1 ATP-binding protein [Dyadobacter chenhuakuii]